MKGITELYGCSAGYSENSTEEYVNFYTLDGKKIGQYLLYIFKRVDFFAKGKLTNNYLLPQTSFIYMPLLVNFHLRNFVIVANMA